MIEIITTASFVGDESFDEYKAAFAKVGAKRTRHMHHNSRSEVLSEDPSDRINEADLSSLNSTVLFPAA